MALTPGQKKWAVGGSIAAAALFIGYELFHGRRAHAGLLPAGLFHGEHEHEHRKKHHHPEEGDEGARENERGTYGRKKHHHHRKHEHD